MLVVSLDMNQPPGICIQDAYPEAATASLYDIDIMQRTLHAGNTIASAVFPDCHTALYWVRGWP